MSIEECPHCLTRVLFNDSGTCPSCGKSKFVSPGKSREQIKSSIEMEKIARQINYYKYRGHGLVWGGLALLLVSLAFTILTLEHGSLIVIWYGGIVAGPFTMMKGFWDFKDAKRLKKMYIKSSEIL